MAATKLMESVNCEICNQDETTFLFSKWGYRMVKCDRCGLAYVNPRSFNVESDEYFKGTYLPRSKRTGC